jgi:hypothetical protein
VVTNIDLDPSKCVINAETLDKNREGLLVVLGTPTEEGWEPADYTDVYRMRYENLAGLTRPSAKRERASQLSPFTYAELIIVLLKELR